MNEKEHLNEMEGFFSEFPKKKGNMWKSLYYISCACVAAGLLTALITYLNQIGWNGIFLAMGCLYPFCIVQTAYIIWYKVGRGKKKIWNIITALAFGVFLFFVINIAESLFRARYYNGLMVSALQYMAGEAVMTVCALGIAIYAWMKSRVKNI